MSVPKINLITYTDPTITDTTPVRPLHLNNIRDNVQAVLTALDKHYGSAGTDAHGTVTTTTPGFAPSSIFTLLDSYMSQIDDLEKMLKDDVYPPYSIAIWNGEKESIPANWVACDGTNGTPDLRYYFPIGVSTTNPLGSMGGSTNVTISNAYRLNAHNHAFKNAVAHASPTLYEPFKWYTDIGTYSPWYSYRYDFDNSIICYNDKTDNAGTSTSTTGNTVVNYMPDHTTKWYIMRLPNSGIAEVPTYTVTVIQPADGKITTNVSGKVKKGTKLVISASADTYYTLQNLKINNRVVANNTTMYVTEDITIQATVSFNYPENYVFSTETPNKGPFGQCISGWSYGGHYDGTKYVTEWTGGKPATLRQYMSVDVIADTTGTYKIVANPRLNFNVNLHSSSRNNSWTRTVVKVGDTTIYDTNMIPNGAYPASLAPSTEALVGPQNWNMVLPEAEATLQKGKNTVSIWFALDYVANRNSGVYIDGLRVTITKK